MILYIILIVLVLYALLKYVYSYWERKGYPQISPTIPTGNMSAMVKQEASFGTAIYNLYHASKEPFVGIYLFFRPALLIRDAKLSKRILTVDFTHFHDRGVHCNEKTNPLSGNLFSLPGDQWKNIRNKLSPTFTSGRLKNMFSTIENVGDAMLQHLNETIDKNGKITELRSLTTCYATDIIGSAFFGLDVNSFKHPDNYLLNIRREVDRRGFLGALSAATSFLCPKLFDLLQLYRVTKEMNQSFLKLVRDTIEYREKNNVVRKDFMQLLLQLRNTGKVKDDSDWNAESVTGTNKSLTMEQCAAQAFIFYIAGLETTAATTAFCLYEMAQNKSILEKALNDINEALSKHDGKLTYDSIKDMQYLELCVLETIRKYPGLPILNRECTKSYQIPNTKYTIEEGTAVVISLLGLHRDPKLFPDPLKFMPERFIDGQRNYEEAAYLPFGEGPRTCIGLRQGKMSVKVGLVKILKSFNMEPIDKGEIEFDTYSVGLVPKNGIHVKLTKIE